MVGLTWLVHSETKGVRLRKLFSVFFGSLKLLFWRRGATLFPPPPPPAMHISSTSTSVFIKTCETSVVLKLQCLKIQACLVLIISVFMDILGSGPLRSLHHVSATKLEKVTGLINWIFGTNKILINLGFWETAHLPLP